MKVVVAGPCGAGKSTLVEQLREAGYQASPVAQEHSYVADMWRRLARPDVLVYLDASLETIRERLGVPWEAAWLAAERHRLRHAREHCTLYVCTDGKSAEEVAAEVLRFLEREAESGFGWAASPPIQTPEDPEDHEGGVNSQGGPYCGSP
ncbi:MAG: hypothetical protein ACUVXG_03395 [Anaerolineae bacterium]